MVSPLSLLFRLLLAFLFLFSTDEAERTCQILPAIRSYVITSSASRSPRFRVRIERFYYDVDYLRSDSNSPDEQRTQRAGLFSYWPMRLVNQTEKEKEREFLFFSFFVLFYPAEMVESLEPSFRRYTVLFFSRSCSIFKKEDLHSDARAEKSLAPSGSAHC